jgi:hypothetical protein
MKPQELDDFLHRNKMTGKELAAKLDVHYVTVSRWRNGREQIPKTVDLALKWIDGEGGLGKMANTTSSFLEMNMKDKILDWFATGRVGASSQAMACAAAGLPSDKSHPCDPDDLNRCLLLLEAVPEIRNKMDKVAAISDTWGKLG